MSHDPLLVNKFEHVWQTYPWFPNFVLGIIHYILN